MMRRPNARPADDPIWEQYRKAPYADSLPAFSDVLSAPGGIIWVRDGRLRFGQPTWAFTAIDTGGRILGRLAGSGSVPIAFGDDRVVFRDEDADGIVTFRVMGLRLPQATDR